MLSQILSQRAGNNPRQARTLADGMRQRDAGNARQRGRIITGADWTKWVRAYSKTGGRRFEPCHSCRT